MTGQLAHATGESESVVVYGASGHTGRFVVAELLVRGYRPVLSGRDGERLRAVAAGHVGLGEGELAVRPAAVDDPSALDRALAGAAAVINCAGPFATTAGPLVEAALRAGIPYLDVAAEIEANVDTFARYADRALAAGVVVLPAMAFFGGLGDLLATAALGDLSAAEEVHVAYGLSGWHPTEGTRAAGAVSRERRGGSRVRYSGGKLEYLRGELPRLDWEFSESMGSRTVLGEFTMADVVTIPSHLAVPEVRTYMTTEAAGELAAPGTPAPTAVDGLGRSAQTFLVDVRVRAGGVERRAAASGQDIYAITAPLVVEALDRIRTGRTRAAGLASAGRLFDAADFLRALAPRLTATL
ncbi:saccharopine dehydrogenase [Kitasatospora sp. MMS16-BH015]|uniref:saccharopine dehydrogenase family protein n=1 Tax=Kitasatospora sp. MMS16-BH015 TaxID=2018025 RepID=UPI000CA1EA13|nr:saccharopine dehydrogenase NADP-binding domain-containing protein [Kitasatospora sp. MMS16-BH015]AUG78139.1 saccharopine dehydrogenase [Kitasatospora sp. MMS16-BH015]